VLSTGAAGMDGLVPVGDSRITRHAARFGPARVLAECEAKREILRIHEWQATDYYGPCGEPCCARRETRYICARCGGLPDAPCDTVKALALTYAEHDDYRPEWRVSP
jgi:hypothetical protein